MHIKYIYIYSTYTYTYTHCINTYTYIYMYFKSIKMYSLIVKKQSGFLIPLNYIIDWKSNKHPDNANLLDDNIYYIYKESYY